MLADVIDGSGWFFELFRFVASGVSEISIFCSRSATRVGPKKVQRFRQQFHMPWICFIEQTRVGDSQNAIENPDLFLVLWPGVQPGFVTDLEMKSFTKAKGRQLIAMNDDSDVAFWVMKYARGRTSSSKSDGDTCLCVRFFP